MRIALFILPVAALGILLGVLVAGVKKGTNIFKLPAVAWMLTGVMVVIAIGIGIGKTEGSHVPEPAPTPGSGLQQGPGSYPSYVRDDASVLSAQTERELAERNQRLWERHSVTVAVITCNYGRDDLGDYAYRQAAAMGLGGYDMIVALDISGDNYWLVQGDDIRRDFTDDDCSNYAYDYMEDYFVRGMYDDAVLELTAALEDWYGSYDR